MIVTKENESNHEIVVKTLRKRQISCFVPIFPKKYVNTPKTDCTTISNPASNNSSKDVKGKRTYKKRTPNLPQILPNTQKRLRFSSTKYKNDFFTPSPTKKRPYRQKNLSYNITFPRSKRTLCLKTSMTNEASVLSKEISKERVYHKKNCMETENSILEKSTEENRSVCITNNHKAPSESMSNPPSSDSKSTYMDEVAVKVEEGAGSTTDTEVSFTFNNDLANDVNSDQIIFLDKIPLEPKKELDLKMDSDISFRLNNESPTKRIYRNKNLKVPTFTMDLLQKTDTSNPILDGQFGGILTIQLPKKRISHKKILSTLSSDSKSALNSSSLDSEPPKKRAYRKRIPSVPHNTPVASRLSQGLDDSTCTSTFSQSSSHDPSFAPPKRGRGRPRLVKVSLPSEEDTSCTLSSLGDSDKEGERQLKHDSTPDEPISEYELQRQRNIQENLKMLRQMLYENGLPMDDKSNNTPKIRRNHTRLPLPPPRPKSARIASSEPLDFSRLADFI